MMRTFKKSRSTIAAIIATLILIQGVGWAKWKDNSDELPGMKSGGEIAMQVGLLVGILAGAGITYHLITKSRNKDKSKSAAAEKSWVVEDPRAVDPALVREAQEAMLKDLVPIRPALVPGAVFVAENPASADTSVTEHEADLATVR